MSFNIEFQNRDILSLSLLDLNKNLDWMVTLKQDALERFKSALLPNRKVEHWKYNDMAFLSEQSYQLAQAPSLKTVAREIECSSKIKLDSSIELIFVDGFLVTPIEELNLINGLTITTFEQTDSDQKKTILSHSDKQANSKNIFIDLNELINQNGLLIEVAENKIIDTPIYLRYFSSERQYSNISSHKTVVNVESSAQLTLIEQFDSSEQNMEQLALQQTSISLGNNSQFSHYRLNIELDSARQISQVRTVLAKDSVMNSFYLGLGSRLNRTDIDVIHAGENAECNLTGIYLPSKNNAIDYHSNIEHRVPHCRTNEVFRGIIADKSSATFNGKIHIFQDAQKSDAYLNNKNLLLTNQAEINTKPELEIYADDVSCAHGATVAQLDEKSMYYLQTRGINRQKAKKMLSIAFIQELLNQIRHDPVKHFLTGILDHNMTQI